MTEDSVTHRALTVVWPLEIECDDHGQAEAEAKAWKDLGYCATINMVNTPLSIIGYNPDGIPILAGDSPSKFVVIVTEGK